MSSQPEKLALARRNCLGRRSESWRPMVFHSRLTWRGMLLDGVRRFLDLQYASIYRDVQSLARGMAGDVLDVGCGSQPFRHLLSDKCRYRGIDSAQAQVDFGPRFPDTTYFDGDQWPVGNESVDYVLSTETMEHVVDSAAFLSEAHRCLRPGGQIILTIPFAARWHFIPHDYWRFTPSALEWLLTRAGFRDASVHARGNAVTVAAYKVMTVILTASLGRETPGSSLSAGRLIARLLGIIAFPLVPLMAVVGQFSLLGEGGDDCLGYTVIARRPDDSRG
jgi:SAM-dependent methyltransferase